MPNAIGSRAASAKPGTAGRPAWNLQCVSPWTWRRVRGLGRADAEWLARWLATHRRDPWRNVCDFSERDIEDGLAALTGRLAR